MTSVFDSREVQINACYHGDSTNYGYCSDPYCDCACYECILERRIKAHMVCSYCRTNGNPIHVFDTIAICEDCYNVASEECHYCDEECDCDERAHYEDECEEYRDDENENEGYEETCLRCGCERTEGGWSYCLAHHPSNCDG